MKRVLFAALIAVVMLSFATGCIDSITPEVIGQDEPVRTVQVQYLPFSVTASTAVEDATKVTVDYGKQHLFQAGDILRVYGSDANGEVSGDLTLDSDAGREEGVFTGTLTYTGEGQPDDNLPLTASLISEGNRMPDDGDRYANAIADYLDLAVQQFSDISGTSTYGVKHFVLHQHSSFIEFVIDVNGLAENGKCKVRIQNRSVTEILASCDTVTIKGGKARFTAAFAGGTQLNQAQVYIDGLIVRFGGSGTKTLEANYSYRVNKKVNLLETPLTIHGCGTTMIIKVGDYASLSTLSFSRNGGPRQYIGRWFPIITDVYQFYDDTPSGHGSLHIEGDVYVYGNFMSIVDSQNYPKSTALTEESVFSNLLAGNTGIRNHATRSILLPATTLQKDCYANLFNGCTGLTASPDLPAETLVEGCYGQMFYGCTNMSSVNCPATDISATDCLKDWLYGVAASGTIRVANSVTWPTGASGVPDGWTLIPIAPDSTE